MKENIITNPSGLLRYGFEFWLKKKLKVPKFFKNHTNWEHGWEFQEFECKNLTIYRTWLNRKMYQVVSSKKKKKFLESLGFKNIYIAPYPFYFFQSGFFKDEFVKLYGENTVIKKNDYKINHSLLVMPNKIQFSTDLKKQQKRINNYIEFVDSLKKDFEKISICVTPEDFKSEIWRNISKKTDLKILRGISPFDGNGYFRLINMFNKYNYITSDCIGSHVLYANLMKKKFSICMPIDRVERNIKEIEVPFDSPISAKKIIDDLEYSYSKSYLKKNFPSLIKSDPSDGYYDYNWAFEKIGENKNINNVELKSILNFSYIKQFQRLLVR